MSQTMTAVFFASHSAGWPRVWKRPLPALVSTRLRSFSDSLAPSARDPAPEAKVMARADRRRTAAGFVMGDTRGGQQELGSAVQDGSPWGGSTKEDVSEHELITPQPLAPPL